MIYGSVCSGIEAATVAWHPLGWRPAFFAEIDKFPSAVLKHHYPEVRNHGDFTTIQAGEYAAIDLLVGGTPCQSFSVAGLRGGMDDARGQLALEFLRLADRLRPRWVVWENVPGVLSSSGGRDFGSFLGGLAELGYGFAYRVLDAQHFGVPQRRRRVFVVGHSGDWRRAAAVLFERHSLSGHPPPRRETGQTSPTVPSRRTGGGGLGTDFDCDGGLVASTVGPCAKATVRCTIVSPEGRWVGENSCRSPQQICPRAPGEGYDKCRTVCGQIGHAEQVAAQMAGLAADGGTAYVEGHTYACEPCTAALAAVGVTRIVIGEPPHHLSSSTGDIAHCLNGGGHGSAGLRDGDAAGRWGFP